MQFQQFSPEKLIGPLNEVEQKNAPSTLFVAGDVALCRNFPRVSVIGTRKITLLGARSTENLVRLLVKRGVAVVSGLALGVDACAHKTATNDRQSSRRR
jgi:DNA processing protein